MPMASRITAYRLGIATAVAMSTPAAAVPAFADQTGQRCNACHVGGYGPQLTAYGREFKIAGYTQRAGGFNLPLSAQVVASYVHTRADQAPQSPSFGPNNNAAFDQISLFIAGGGGHFGGFAQITHDGIAATNSWDNLDLRAVTHTKIAGADAVVGLSFNNGPGIEDPWNTLPAWGFPYTGSAFQPGAPVSPLLAGGLAQEVMGLTAYAWIDHRFYIEAGGYRTPSASVLNWLGADPLAPGAIDGVAPYVRLAWQKAVGGGDLQLGAFLLRASLFPGRDISAGTTDRYTDVGLDASYMLPRANGDTFSVNARYMHESQDLRATFALGGASNMNNDLDDWRLDVAYYWRNVVGATVGFFDTTGSSDPILFGGANGRPDTTGFVFQVDGTPFGNGSPLGNHLNVRVGVQYTAFTRFNGALHNYDGAGANAADNNSLRIFAWFAF